MLFILTASHSAGLQCPLDRYRCCEDCRWPRVGRVAHRGWSPLQTYCRARVLTQSDGKHGYFKHTHTHRHRLTCFTETSSESFGTAAPVEAHTHSTVFTRFLTSNRLCERQRSQHTVTFMVEIHRTCITFVFLT